MAGIRIYGDPILRKISDPVTKFDAQLHEFVEQMKEDLYTYDGVGLAAPQVGRSIQVAVIDVSSGEQKPQVLINPHIYYFSQERSDYDEGCLSIPGITIKINRPSVISVRAYDEKGEQFVLENIDGLYARVVQHETDHLNGVLFIDHASSVNRQLISGKLKKMVKSHRDTSKAA